MASNVVSYPRNLGWSLVMMNISDLGTPLCWMASATCGSESGYPCAVSINLYDKWVRLLNWYSCKERIILQPDRPSYCALTGHYSLQFPYRLIYSTNEQHIASTKQTDLWISPHTKQEEFVTLAFFLPVTFLCLPYKLYTTVENRVRSVWSMLFSSSYVTDFCERNSPSLWHWGHSP